MFSIVVTGPDSNDERHTFTTTDITVGRVAGNDIVLKQTNISKRHSRLVLKNGAFILIDLKSTNGTLVNGRKITAPQQVTSADRITIGDYTLQLLQDAVDSPGDGGNETSAEVPPSAVAGIESLGAAPEGPPEGGGARILPLDSVQGSTLESPTTPTRAARPAPPPVPGPAVPPPARRPITPGRMPSVERVVPRRGDVRRPATGEMEAFSSGLTPTGTPADATAHTRRWAEVELMRASDAFTLSLPENTEEIEHWSAELVNHWIDTEPELTETVRPLGGETVREAGRRAMHRLEAGGQSAPASVSRDALIQRAGLELVGLGPIELLLADPTVTQIHVNAWDGISAVRDGAPSPVPMRFASDRSWQRVAGRLHSHARFSDITGGTMRLEGGGRLDLVLPPISVNGATLSLVRPNGAVPDLDELVATGLLSADVASFLGAAVQGGAGLLIASREITDASLLFEALIAARLPEQRTVVVQEVARQGLQQPGVIRLEQAPGQWPSAACIGFGLAPTLLGLDPLSPCVAGDWLLGGASRSFASMVTLPARTPAEALSRLQLLAASTHAVGGLAADRPAVQRQLLATLDLVIFLSRDSAGTLSLAEIAEISDVGAEGLSTTPVLVSRDGTRPGLLEATGHIPRCVRDRHRLGPAVPQDLFRPR